MAQTLDLDTNAVGGGFGGMGGFGSNNPLLWLITLGFLRGNNGLFGGEGSQGAGVLAGETQAKLDCLQQGHNALSRQIESNSLQGQFATLSGEVNNVGNVARDSRDLFTNQITTLAQSLAECCCDLKTGQQSIKTDVAMQTAALIADGKDNTRAILDKLNDNALQAKDAEIRGLEQQIQTQTILANCGGGHGGGNSIDINVLARALQSQGQVAA